jgi:hypothetical protein
MTDETKTTDVAALVGQVKTAIVRSKPFADNADYLCPVTIAEASALLDVIERQAAENERLRGQSERDARRADVADARVAAWERQVYMVDPLAPLMAVPDTDFADKVPPVPAVKRVTDLLDRIEANEAKLREAIKLMRVVSSEFSQSHPDIKAMCAFLATIKTEKTDGK